MKIHFLKEDALIALKTNVQANLTHYRKPTNEWIYDYFQGEDPFMEANFECDDFQLLISPKKDEVSSTDAQNVRIIYTALKNLTDTQATDERLWAGLCHYDLWDYMSRRWKMEDDKTTTQLILSRYFISNAFGKKRGLTVNTLSKLWWIGRLTYDQHRADPFALLKYFETDFSTKLLLMFSNNFMSNFEITSGLLEALIHLDSLGYNLKQKRNPQSFGQKEVYLKATGYLNVLGGTHVLDYYSKDEIKGRILDYMLAQPHILKDECLVIPTESSVESEKQKREELFPTTLPEAVAIQCVPEQIALDASVLDLQKLSERQAQNLESREPAFSEEPDRTIHSIFSSKATSPVFADDICHQKDEESPSKGQLLSQIDDKLISYCKDMRMSYSYKAVLLLALFKYIEEDGKMAIQNAIPFFRQFYRNRIEKGLPAELKSSIYSDLEVDDAKILSNITRNPISALILSKFFEFDTTSQRFGFKPEIWAGITEFGRKKMEEATKARLSKYYNEVPT